MTIESVRCPHCRLWVAADVYDNEGCTHCGYIGECRICGFHIDPTDSDPQFCTDICVSEAAAEYAGELAHDVWNDQR